MRHRILDALQALVEVCWLKTRPRSPTAQELDIYVCRRQRIAHIMDKHAPGLIDKGGVRTRRKLHHVAKRRATPIERFGLRRRVPRHQQSAA